MSKTRHMQARMSQRAISQEIIDVVLQYAVVRGDKFVVNKKAAKAVLAELDKQKKLFQRIYAKGGVIVVAPDGEVLVTTYDLDSYRQAS